MHSRECDCMGASLRRLGNRSLENAPDKIRAGAKTKHECSHPNEFAAIAAELRATGTGIRNQWPAGQGSRSDATGDLPERAGGARIPAVITPLRGRHPTG